MKLLTSPASPFGSKVKLFASQLGILDRIEIEAVDTIGLARNGDHPNPLGKIPCLILSDGRSVFDSQVICDFLGAHADQPQRLAASLDDKISLAAINGMTEAALLLVYEGRMRPEPQHNAEWMAMQQRKVDNALDWLASRLPNQENLVGVSLAAALGYLDLRFEGNWRSEHADLVAWLDQFSAKLPAYEHLKPH